MTRTTTLIIGTAAVAVIVGVAGVANASSGAAGDDNERPITGDALTRASEVALAHTGEGSVTETEVGDEDSFYEVEVTLDSGQQVDVQLDENFDVVGSELDDEHEDGDS